MARRMDWVPFRIGINPKHNTLFIGKWGKLPDTDRLGWISQSANRTKEIVTMLAAKMRYDIDRNNNADKPYVGYEVPGVGKLVLIKKGFDFSVKPAPRKSSK